MPRLRTALTLLILFAAACHHPPEATPPSARSADRAVAVRDTTRADLFEASGVADPIQQATLSTRLMGTVTEVHAVEGARVASGELLVRLDAADLVAQRRRATAGLDDATTMRDLARLTADRMRRMYADSAAPRAQLDAAESGLARASAQVNAATEAIADVDANAQYAEIRAPFAGVITRRFVDPGAFAAPGAPLITIQETDRLRLTVSVPAALAGSLRAGRHLAARIEQLPAGAIVEGAVPTTGNMYAINALVTNHAGTFLPGSAATLLVPSGSRHVLLIPATALVHQGDLVGVRRRFAGSDELTWITIGDPQGGNVEVLAGLAPGDSVLVPSSPAGAH